MPKIRKPSIRIGTSGWSYPHWRDAFYPHDLGRGGELAFYAQHFGTVEINNTFYRLPEAGTVRHWREQTPASFLFSCKMSRFVSHMKKLKDPSKTLPPFLERVSLLGSKLGPLLVQLPPRWRVNADRLAAFLGAVPKGYRIAVEFRDSGWWTEPVYQVLRDHNAAFCIFDLGGKMSPRAVTADFVYFRLHGPKAAYAGSYSDTALRGFAKWCREWQGTGLDVYGYFDNDENAFAVQNARRLTELTGFTA